MLQILKCKVKKTTYFSRLIALLGHDISFCFDSIPVGTLLSNWGLDYIIIYSEPYSVTETPLDWITIYSIQSYSVTETPPDYI